MSFLIDLNQVEQSGINYIEQYLNLNDLYIVKNTGFSSDEKSIISGDFFSINPFEDTTFIEGNIKSNTGIVFTEDGKIGIKCYPEVNGLQIGNYNEEYNSISINERRAPLGFDYKKKPKIILTNNANRASGIITMGVRRNNLILDPSRTIYENNNNLSAPCVSFISDKSELSITEEYSNFKNLSINSNVLENKIKKNASGNILYIDEFQKNSTKNYYCISNLFDFTGKNEGFFSFGLCKGLLYTGSDFIVENIRKYDNEKYEFSVKNSDDYKIQISGVDPDFNLIGSITSTIEDIKKQYYVTGNDLGILNIQNEVTGFYTGQYTIYIKKIEPFYNMISSPFTGYQNSLIRNPLLNIDSNITNWHLYQNIQGNLQRIVLSSINSLGTSVCSGTINITTNANRNFIYLIKINNQSLNQSLKIASYNTISNTYNVINSTLGNSPEIFYSNPDPTQIIIQSGCIYEFGLIDKITSNSEDTLIFNNKNIIDSITSQSIKFLFKLNNGYENIIEDNVNNFTGFISGYKNEYWI
jgi:hypothetical protein